MQLFDPVLDVAPLSVSLIDGTGRRAEVGDDEACVVRTQAAEGLGLERTDEGVFEAR